MNARSRVPALMVVLVLAACIEMGRCVNYTVGEGFTNGNANTSWTNTVNGLLRPAVLEAAYQQWAESVNVTVGDTLVFDYERGRLPRQDPGSLYELRLQSRLCRDYVGCRSSNLHYQANRRLSFLHVHSSGHCEGGQKVKIAPFEGTTATSITPPTSSPSNAPQQPNLIFGMIITLFLMYYLPFFIQ